MSVELGHIRFHSLSGGDRSPRDALGQACPDAPYLAGLHARFPEVLDQVEADGPDAAFARIVASLAAAGEADSVDAGMLRMRQAKGAAHLLIAACDLAGVWPLDQVVEALTHLADLAVETALRLAVRAVSESGRAPAGFNEAVAGGRAPSGLFVLAMGKMGARELNYSSDVDLVLLYDRTRIPGGGDAIKDVATRIARELVRILESRTVDGYVFRTDLRLRPDPGSTPLAVSTQFAKDYYETVGQNWERMAHIKARACAGDREAAEVYLKDLAPYVWRRHLDYWAIADIHSIKRQIHSHGQHAPLGMDEFDVKLGVGGIREVEFFAQVQQLILGGRLPALRTAKTKATLAQMVAAGVLTPAVHADLTTAYDFLRRLEHRLQMVNDEQTHLLPAFADKRERAARLCGYRDVAEFESDLLQVRQRVHGVYSDLFAHEERLSSETGNLVFTGVDDDPGTVETLKAMGFGDPSHIISTYQNWHRGGVSATRSARGRQLFTILGPRLLTAMSEAGAPDQAFERFRVFFGGLTAGVQTMSLMLAEPALTRDLIETMTFAPKLADDLARRPALLDAMMDRRFQAPVTHDPVGEAATRLRTELASAQGFEAALNIARRFHREEAFRIGYQLLRRSISAAEAGVAYAELADACVSLLAEAAEAEVLSRFSGAIGRWAVCGLGKFGGREMSASSDLDMMLVYDRADDEPGEALASRFVQRLIAALSAPTEEGRLYEVDTQLRPSGRSGPVAVKWTSFQTYYESEAWTWEFMALTRLRPVAGDPVLQRQIVEAAHRDLRRKGADPKLTPDIADMRRRLWRERPGKTRWDLKLAPGGLVDLEFVIQHEILKTAADHPEVIHPTSSRAIDALEKAGSFSAEEARLLRDALNLQVDLQQALRVAVGDRFEPALAPQVMKDWLAKLVGLSGFEELESLLAQRQDAAAALRQARLGPLSTEGAG